MTLTEITESPWLNLASGLILLITSGYEAWNSIGNLSLHAYHGVAAFGLIQTIKAIPELLHGLKEVQEGRGKIHHKPIE